MNTKELIKDLMSGQSDKFTLGLSELISNRAKEMVNDYKSVAFSNIQEESVELEEGRLKYGEEYPKAKIMKMIRDGEWEAMTDIKPGKAIEMQHVDSGKKVMIYIKEDIDNLNEISDFKRREIAYELRHEKSTDERYTIWLKVPFKDKDKVKGKKGVRWSPTHKKWYVTGYEKGRKIYITNDIAEYIDLDVLSDYIKKRLVVVGGKLKESNNESINESASELKKLKDAISFFEKKIKEQGMVTNARDEDHLANLKKLYKDMGGK